MSLLVPRNLHAWTGSLLRIRPLVLWEDQSLIVAYKPSTILAQRAQVQGPHTDNMLDAVKLCLQQHDAKDQRTHLDSAKYVGLVHRLDRPASGVMVFAKTPQAAASLSREFQRRSVIKEYLCLVNGRIRGDAETGNRLRHWLTVGSGEKSLVSETMPTISDHHTQKMVEAELSFDVLHVFSHTQTETHQSLVRVKLETGRKHQIRAQLAHVGHPIVGDVKYGAPQRFKLRDIALHAYRLSFLHPGTKQRMCFSCRVPSSWASRFGPEVAEIADRLADNDG